MNLFALFNAYFFLYDGNYSHEVCFKDFNPLHEIFNLASKDIMKIGSFYFIDRLDSQFSLLLCHCLQVIQGTLFYENFLVPEKNLSISKLVWNVFEDERFAELFEIFFILSLYVFCKAEDVLLYLEEFFQEFFERTAIDIS